MSMFTYIILISMFIFPQFSYSADADTDNTKIACAALEDTATAIMKARQAGVSLSKSISIIMNSDELDDAYKKLITTIIKVAYEKPIYDAEIRKELAMVAFGNDIYVKCVEEIGK